MTEAAFATSLFGERQDHLPGLAQAGRAVRGRRPLVRRDCPSQLPLMMPVRDLDDPPPAPRPIPGQLALGPEQMELSDHHPEPMQLCLLDDPPPWEEALAPAPNLRPAGRLAKRRAKMGISPGQIPLF